MTIETEEPALTVDELAARAGVTVRTVRFYGTKGLLPRRSSVRAGWGTTVPGISRAWR